MAKGKKVFDPEANFTKAEAAIQAGDRYEANRLLKMYRRWRLAGNPAPAGADERYGELMDRAGPEFAFAVAEPPPSDHQPPPGNLVRSLAALLLNIVRRKQEKDKGVKIGPIAALNDAEQALQRGDVETAQQRLDDYDGFRICGGKEPPGGRERYDLIQERLSALRGEPW
jgi:hypothetical protein